MDTNEKEKQAKGSDDEEVSNSETESVKNTDVRPSSSASYYSAEETNDGANEYVAESAANARSEDSDSDKTEEEDTSTQETIAEKKQVDTESNVNPNEATGEDNVSVDTESKSSVSLTETESNSTDAKVNTLVNKKPEDSEEIEVNESELEGSEINSNVQVQEKANVTSNEDEVTNLQVHVTDSTSNIDCATQEDTLQKQNVIELTSDKGEDNQSNQNIEAMEVSESVSEVNKNQAKSSNMSPERQDEVGKERDEKNVEEPAEKILDVVESVSEQVCDISEDKTNKTSDDNENKSDAEPNQVHSIETMEVSEFEPEENFDKNDQEESEKQDAQQVEDKTGNSQAKGTEDKDDVASQYQSDDLSETNLTEDNVNDESILPDTESQAESETIEEDKDTDENEQFTVANYTEKSTHDCMQCKKSSVPKYICTIDENTSYICSDMCLNNLKEKKPGKVTVKGLRVKMFASEDLSHRPTVTTPTTPTISTDVECFPERCKQCSKKIGHSNYICWNTYDFCNSSCLSVFQKLAGVWCVECKTVVPENLLGKYSVRFGNEMKQFCKNACLLDHKKGEKFCSLCQGQIKKDHNGFCSKKCYDVHNSVNMKKTGLCAVCLKEKVLEIEFIKDDKKIMFCGEPCFVAYKFVNKLEPQHCEFCKIYKSGQKLTCSFSFGGASHYLCSKDCQKLFIITNRKIVHCLWCNVKKYNFDMIQIVRNNTQFVVCSLNCYKLYEMSLTTVQTRKVHGCDFCNKDVKPLFHLTTLDGKVHNFCSSYCLNLFKEKLAEDSTRPQVQSTTAEVGTDNQVNGTGTETKRPVKKIVVVKPRPIPKQRNISTMCKPYQITKSINCRPKESQKSCQTEEFSNKFFLPIPVPIYVPTPAHMYAQPVPMPVPFPLPIPVPIFIPTTRKSASGIMKEINKIKTKVPADPLEAELLMMAEMVAGDKKDDTDSESDDDAAAKEFSSEQLDTNNSFGEDVLQMALKMASDFEEPVDLEGAVSATTISAQSGQEDSAQRIESIMETKRRNIRQARQTRRKPSQGEAFNPPSSQAVELEKPDANMCLKYTFGVNAWKQWVTTKNLELQKTSKRVKLFKTEILQLTADELNFSLCLFVKEVRKPNGTEYAPDTIYYLCLGIQQYLYENGRIDNIFCDTFYEKFTDCLNEVCRKFSLLYNESQYIVTRVEEEHLWESKQLGAHSPLVLLNTLMFFNTKHFSLTTVDEHLQLSFSHIMKHWKRNPNQPGARNVLLRFYPPQTSDGPRKKKVYEQQENEDNPLRCPVKLYEFYMSKCPESVKTRNDVFYLQPERSCVPDSPVWYSTMALGKDPLEKMLNRVKMVKEINIALLTT